jgi:16S rRNA (uracil1498-N3)-methyltransferase
VRSTPGRQGAVSWDVENERFLYISPADLRLPEGPLLSTDESHHAIRVCRLKKGDRVRGIDGEGHDLLLEVGEKHGRRIQVHVVAERDSERERPPDIALALPLLHHPTRLDWMIEKATELGVHRFWPVRTARTTVVPVEERTERRIERWGRIVVAAMKQAGRAWRPPIEAPEGFVEMLDAAGSRRILWATPRGGAMPSGEELQREAGDGLLVMVGPEGGWQEDEEERLARTPGWAVSLGEHKLRSETAVLTILSLLQDRLRRRETRGPEAERT